MGNETINSSGIHNIFEAMVRQFLLSFITILSTQLLNASELALAYSIVHAERTGNFDFYYTAYIFFFFSSTTDLVVSTLYIVLSFSSIYWKICACPHGICVKMWQRSIYRDIRRKSCEMQDVELKLDEEGARSPLVGSQSTSA